MIVAKGRVGSMKKQEYLKKKKQTFVEAYDERI